jgi:phosphomannomutase
MCGIVAYIGQKDALPMLVGGLKKLEYRGYDSSGVALIDNGKINVVRASGKIKALEDKYAGEGRVLIRPSGTEPLVRVMIEGRDKSVIDKDASDLAALIEKELG